MSRFQPMPGGFRGLAAAGMLCGVFACKPSAAPEYQTLSEPVTQAPMDKESKMAQFEANLRRCIAAQFPNAPVAEETPASLVKVWESISNEAGCTGCHYSKTALGDTNRVMVDPNGGIEEYLTGLARRDRFTRTIAETCMVDTPVKAKLIEALGRGKVSWTNDDGVTLDFFKVPTGTSVEDREGIGRHYLSGGFGEPVSEDPLEAMVQWMGEGGRFKLDHHVQMILGELEMISFNSSDRSRWDATRIDQAKLAP